MMSRATKTAKNSSFKTEVRYIVNDKGEKTEVVLPIELYERLLDEVEELEDIKDFDEAMKKDEWEDFEKVTKRLDV
jgi:enolase